MPFFVPEYCKLVNEAYHKIYDMDVINYTTQQNLRVMDRNQERLRFLREKMFPVFEWFEVMKHEELEEYCEIVSRWNPTSRKIWKKMLQIYYQIYFREKLYGARDYQFKQ
jgi:hypothetical protein